MPHAPLRLALVASSALLAGCAWVHSSEDPLAVPGDEACSPGSLLHGADDPVRPTAADPDAQFPWDQEHPTVAQGFAADDHLFVLGGDPGGGIPSLDQPCFEPVGGGGDWLEPASPVLAIEHRGEARAYPLAILHFHEIVNDVVGGEPVAITYCPLCNSGLAFERTDGDTILEFGASDRLYRSNLVMYDRQTRNLWLQFTGQAIAGEPFVGSTLTRLPTAIVSWQRFGEDFPDGWVLTRETGFQRDYDVNPYVGYRSAALPDGVEFDQNELGRESGLGAKSRVIGLHDPDSGDAVAIPLDDLAEARTSRVELGRRAVVVLWAPEMADALDGVTVDEGRDIGQTGAFVPALSLGDSKLRLTLEPDPDDDQLFLDAETGSSWTVLGRAVAGPLEGERLPVAARDDTMWFVWLSFHPNTMVHNPP